VRALVVVENPAAWPLRIKGVEVVSARAYLTEPSFADERRVSVFNLCRTYRPQTLGYYVSLLALARGHRALPSVQTLQDLRMPHLLRLASDDLEQVIQRSLRHIKRPTFNLSIYFGRNMARRYDRLCEALFAQFPAPMLRARFVRETPETSWRLERLRPIAAKDIPERHHPFVEERAREYLSRPRRRSAQQVYRYEIAILTNPEELEPPSNRRAIARFVAAARQLGMDATEIGPEDFGRIAEFDALFIRETTRVDHHTFRFARRGVVEGLVVIDDPDSIVRCTNKVFLAEAFARRGIACPTTLIVDTDDAELIEKKVGLPCVLKEPDSSFSRGVIKVGTPAELREQLARVLEESELAIAQAYTPSPFDWRIGILEGRPLWACRYHMAPGHWQVVSTEQNGDRRWGGVEAVALDRVPPRVLAQAVRAAALVGNGLYGVDVKPVGSAALVIEVNDNPTIEAGDEDGVLGDALYLEIMGCFRRRLDARGLGGAP
jgi:glutathione synthase/RimK-type ligase-like ATP-grasp enzyme